MKSEQLRKAILQMAIQGKLVPQDPNDEPASVLLEKIRAEKQRLIKEGKIKKDKIDSVIFKGDDNRHYEKVGNNTPVCIEDELPFDIPDSWEWIRLGYLISIISGVSYDKKDVCKSGIRILRGGNINNLQVLTLEDDVFLPKTYEDGDKQVRLNDILIVASTGSKTVIGKAGYINKELRDTQIGAFLRIVRPLFDELVDYIKLVFATDYYREHIRTQAQGTNINNVKAEYITQLLVPIPPLNEQAHIVAEIEKYEPLIEEYDKLELQKSKLNNEIYDRLKKSILQYAIQGKLVPQDENDEPASELLKCIRAEKKVQLGKKCVESYIYKGDDNCYYEKVGSEVKNITEEIPFDIPKNWEWTRLSNICDYIHRGKSPVYGTTKKLPIIAQKCNQWDKIYTDRCLFAEESTIKKYQKEQFLCIGDIIVNSTGTGTVGRIGYVDKYIFQEYSNFVADSHVTVVRANHSLFTKYLYLFLMSPQIQTDIESKCSGSTNQIELSTSTIRNYLIPIPPFQEQVYIVELYEALIDKLKDEV